MADEFLFAAFFAISFIIFWSVRGYYIRKTRDSLTRRTRAERREAMKKERWTGIAIVIFTPLEIAIVVLYFINPLWLSLNFLLIPELARWVGLIILFQSIPLAAWVHQALGRSYSYALETKTEQTLITSGPFSRVRHPLYSAHNIFNLGKVILTMNIPLIIIAIIGVPLTYTRMRDEERMIIQQFGEEYEEFIRWTGRIFPKIVGRPKT